MNITRKLILYGFFCCEGIDCNYWIYLNIVFAHDGFSIGVVFIDSCEIFTIDTWDLGTPITTLTTGEWSDDTTVESEWSVRLDITRNSGVAAANETAHHYPNRRSKKTVRRLPTTWVPTTIVRVEVTASLQHLIIVLHAPESRVVASSHIDVVSCDAGVARAPSPTKYNPLTPNEIPCILHRRPT